MATVFNHFPPAAAALIASRLLNKHSAHEIAEAVEVLIDVLDLIGGDADAEEDDPPGQCDEDEINTMLALSYGNGPGCLISDDDCENDGREIDDGI